MFSPNVQSDVRKTIASQQFTNIEDICNELNQEAIKRNFLREPVELDESEFNRFVESFACENGMQVRTVQPFAWSFSIDDHKLFDDGVVELSTLGGKHFSCTKVDESKITQSNKGLSSESENLFAHQAWIKKLNEQVAEWEIDLKSLADIEKQDLGVKLKKIKSLLDELKTSSMNVSREAIIETERQWNSFQETFGKIKNKMKKSSS